MLPVIVTVVPIGPDFGEKSANVTTVGTAALVVKLRIDALCVPALFWPTAR